MSKTCLGLIAFLLLSSFASAQESLFTHDKVRDLYFTFKQANWWTVLRATEQTRTDIKADLKVDGKTYSDVGIRIRGSSSNRMPGNKKPFNLTTDSFVPGQKVMGISTVNINNGALDPTMTREVTAFHIYRKYMPAPRTAYVRVHLNGTFWGVYILVEQTNKDFVRGWFKDEDGSRYKGDRPGRAAVGTSTLAWLGTNVANYQQRYEIKTPSHANAWKDLINVCDKLNNTSNAQFKQEIVKWIDVDRALWYFACGNLIVNSDDYMGAGHNYYMYFDPQDGRMSMIAVDGNEAYGVHGPSTNPHRYSVLTGASSFSRPLVRRILAVPEWREAYYAHYRTVLRRWGDWTTQIAPLTKKLQDSIRADIAKDKNYFYTQAQFSPSAPRFFSVFHWVPTLDKLVKDRKTFLQLDSNLTKPEPQISNVSYPKHKVASGSRVQVTARVVGSPSIRSVTLRSSVVGPYADNTMFDDGKHGDGKANDGIWGGSFVAAKPGETMRFYIHATNAAGTVAFEPEGAEHSHYTVGVTFPVPTGPIVINELLADNDAGDKDQKGEFEDWVEIHNRGKTAYDISGHWLSDDPQTPRKWQFPANTKVAAGGYLRVWCDNEPLDGPLHATFKLAKSGESVALYDTDARANKLLDGIAFDQQKGDRSFGRFPDGSRWLHYLWTPSGASPQFAPATILRYDGRRTGSAANLRLKGSGVARVGQVFRWEIEGGPASGAAVILLSGGVVSAPIGPLGHLDIDPATLVPVVVVLDAAGRASIPYTVPASFAGLKLFQQALVKDLSNGLAVWFR